MMLPAPHVHMCIPCFAKHDVPHMTSPTTCMYMCKFLGFPNYKAMMWTTAKHNNIPNAHVSIPCHMCMLLCIAPGRSSKMFVPASNKLAYQQANNPLDSMSCDVFFFFFSQSIMHSHCNLSSFYPLLLSIAAFPLSTCLCLSLSVWFSISLYISICVYINISLYQILYVLYLHTNVCKLSALSPNLSDSFIS